MWKVYLLLSQRDNKRYIGSTNNLERRISEHNRGLVKSTRNRIPLKIIYTEDFNTESEARNREHFLKTHKGFNELRKILNNGL